MKFKNELNQLSRSLFVLFTLSVVVLMQGCFHNKGSSPAPDPDPTGYYKQGTLSVNNDSVVDDAVQAIIYNNRFLMVSTATGTDYLYEGQMVIDGDSFTINATIYTNGNGESGTTTTTITGTINAGSDITGELKGTGIGAGSFTLSYAQSNNTQTADIDNIMGSAVWSRKLVSSVSAHQFKINTNGSTTPVANPINGFFGGCPVTGTLKSIVSTNLYEVTLTLDSCESGGVYTGFAVSEDPYAELFLAVTGVTVEFKVKGGMYGTFSKL